MKNEKIINIILLTIMLVITARFLVAGWNRLMFNANSADGDQGAYLQLGLDLREQGILVDGPRNPLYPLLLSTFAHRDWSYFTWAKLANFMVGLMTIWAVFLIGRRLFNPVSGVLAALLLSINIEFIMHATFALAEPLLILCVLLAWFTMVRALQAPDRLRYWLLGGGLAGLAYLAKGSGPLIAICFAATATLLYGPKVWFRRIFWGFVVAFCLVALPLWAYNWINFGSPLYNPAINNVMWMDESTERYVADSSDLPTLSSFLQEKSVGETWNRLWDGLLLMRYNFARMLWPTRSLAFDRFFEAGGLDLILIGAIVILGFLLLFFRQAVLAVWQRHRELLLLTAVMVATFYVLFGWYAAISSSLRFLLPLAPVLFLLLSAGIVGLLRTLFVSARIPQWVKVAAGVVICLLLLQPVGWFGVTGYYLMAQSAQKNPFTVDAEFNDYTDEALRWVQTGHNNGDPITVMWGPTHLLPVWRHSHRLTLIRTPVSQAEEIDELNAFLEQGEVTYVIVDSGMVNRMGQDNAARWGIRKVGNDRLDLDGWPQDWALAYAWPEMPCQWCVFRRLTAPPTFERVDYLLGNSIFLFGYELDQDRYQPGDQLVVTLFWASVQPVATDYTVFTQLLGPDFQLHGQMDRQPLDGRWPTSLWQPDQKFVDKFVLDIDPAAPAGEYVLLTGLYDGQTGQRLPVTGNGEAIPDDAIPLVRLTIQETGTHTQ
jgi:hypothetical protein